MIKNKTTSDKKLIHIEKDNGILIIFVYNKKLIIITKTLINKMEG
jgi:hypothetical protein